MNVNQLTLPRSEDNSKIKLSTAVLLLTFAVALLALICLGVGAADDSDADDTQFTVDGIKYDVVSDYVIVSGYGVGLPNDVTIPATVTHKEVTYNVNSISGTAFRSCTSITSVTIGSNVSSIGNSAFERCTSITSVIIGSNVSSIGNSAFNGCTSITSLTIGSNVENIGQSAFSGCKSLTSVIIPDKVSEIGQGAFSSCASITSLTIGSNVENIGQSAFSGCTSLTSVIIPDKVTQIGKSAFYSCTSLTSVTIGIGVTSIGSSAFKTSDGNGYSALQSITIDEGNKNFSSDDGVLFDKNKSNLILYPGGKTAASYDIPSSVKTISDSAFYGSFSLTSVTIPYGVETIEDNVFKYCNSLPSINIPASVTSIGAQSIVICASLVNINVDENNENYSSDDGVLFNKNKTSLLTYPGGRCGDYTVPNSVKSIGKYAFNRCSNLSGVVLPNGLESIDYSFIDNYYMTSVTLGTGTPVISDGAFNGCCNLVEICNNSTLPLKTKSTEKGTGNIAKYAVNIYSSTSGASILKEQSVGADSKAVYYELNDETTLVTIFQYDNALILPESLGTKTAYKINDYAFRSSNIETVSITGGVTAIGNNAFMFCKSLTSVSIGACVESIGDNAFASCLNLTNVTVMRDNSVSLTTLGAKAFNSCSADLVIMVPANSLTGYKGATNWSSYADKIFADISECTVLDIEDQTYNREQITPTVTVKNGTTVLTLDTDYTVEYGENFNAGTGTVTITGAGSYIGSIDKTFNIVPAELSVIGTTMVPEKIYDGKVTATVGSIGILQGVIGTDEVTISAATGEFDNKNVGNDKDVTVKYTLSGKDAGNYTVSDYETSASILQKEVTVGGIKANNKEYDGNTNAELDYSSVTGFITGDTVTVSANGAFSDKTVGTGKTVSISDIAISGTDAGNYTLATSGQQTSATADITVKAVTVTGITANNKEYDGNTSAVLDYSGVTITGIVGTDVVTVTAVGTFSDIYIGTSKTVTISNIVLAGADAGNYVLASTGQQTSTTAHITGTVKFQYENTAKAADDITLVDSVPVTEPTLPLTENKIVAGWYNGNVLWNFSDKVKVSMTLTVKISEVTSGATVIQAEDKKAVDVELKTGTTSVKAILSDGTVSVSDLNSTDRLKISVEKDAASADKFDVTVKLGDAVYTDKPIVITLQYDKVKGVPNAYYYPADGSKVKMDSSVDESAGTVTFTTTHNSVYGIEYTAEPKNGVNIAAVIICVVLDIVIVLGIAVYFVRHKN